jgi:hypothetical protein
VDSCRFALDPAVFIQTLKEFLACRRIDLIGVISGSGFMKSRSN